MEYGISRGKHRAASKSLALVLSAVMAITMTPWNIFASNEEEVVDSYSVLQSADQADAANVSVPADVPAGVDDTVSKPAEGQTAEPAEEQAGEPAEAKAPAKKTPPAPVEGTADSDPVKSGVKAFADDKAISALTVTIADFFSNDRPNPHATVTAGDGAVFYEYVDEAGYDSENPDDAEWISGDLFNTDNLGDYYVRAGITETEFFNAAVSSAVPFKILDQAEYAWYRVVFYIEDPNTAVGVQGAYVNSGSLYYLAHIGDEVSWDGMTFPSTIAGENAANAEEVAEVLGDGSKYTIVNPNPPSVKVTAENDAEIRVEYNRVLHTVFAAFSRNSNTNPTAYIYPSAQYPTMTGTGIGQFKYGYALANAEYLFPTDSSKNVFKIYTWSDAPKWAVNVGGVTIPAGMNQPIYILPETMPAEDITMFERVLGLGGDSQTYVRFRFHSFNQTGDPSSSGSYNPVDYYPATGSLSFVSSLPEFRAYYVGLMGLIESSRAAEIQYGNGLTTSPSAWNTNLSGNPGSPTPVNVYYKVQERTVNYILGLPSARFEDEDFGGSEQRYPGTVFDAVPEVFVPGGFTFEGWYDYTYTTDPDGEKYIPGSSIMQPGDMNLYAKWKPVRDIRSVSTARGGGVYKDQSYAATVTVSGTTRTLDSAGNFADLKDAYESWGAGIGIVPGDLSIEYRFENGQPWNTFGTDFEQFTLTDAGNISFQLKFHAEGFNDRIITTGVDVSPRPLEVQIGSNEVFDTIPSSTTLNVDEDTNGGPSQLIAGETITPTAITATWNTTDSQTWGGTDAINDITDKIFITKADGSNSTGNYAITIKKGTLTVKDPTITDLNLTDNEELIADEEGIVTFSAILTPAYGIVRGVQADLYLETDGDDISADWTDYFDSTLSTIQYGTYLPKPLSELFTGSHDQDLYNGDATISLVPKADAAGRTFTYSVTISKGLVEETTPTANLTVADPSITGITAGNANLTAGTAGNVLVTTVLNPGGIVRAADFDLTFKTDGDAVDWTDYFSVTDSAISFENQTVNLAAWLGETTQRLSGGTATISLTPLDNAAGREFKYTVTAGKGTNKKTSNEGTVTVADATVTSIIAGNADLTAGTAGDVSVTTVLSPAGGIVRAADFDLTFKTDGDAVDWTDYFSVTDSAITFENQTVNLAAWLGETTQRLSGGTATISLMPLGNAAGREFKYTVTAGKGTNTATSNEGTVTVADPPALSVSIDAKDSLNLEIEKLGEIKVQPEFDGIIRGAKAIVVLKDQDGVVVNWETYFGTDATVTAGGNTASLSAFLGGTFRLTNDELTVKATPAAIAAGRSFTYEVTLRKDGAFIASDTANLTVADPPASSVFIDAKDSLNLEIEKLGEIKVEPTLVGIIQGAKAIVVLKDQDGVVVSWETYFGTDATVTADGRTALLSDFLDVNNTFRLTNDELTVKATPAAIAAGRSFTYEVTLRKDGAFIASDTANLTVADPPASSVAIDAKDNLNLKSGVLGEIKVEPTVVGIIQGAKATVVLKDQDGVVVNWETYFGADATVTSDGRTAPLSDFLDANNTFRLTNDELTVKATPAAIAAGRSFTYEVTLSKDGAEIASDTGELKVKEPSYSSVTIDAKNNLGLESGVLGEIEVEPTLVGIIQGAKATVVLKDQDGVVVNWETYFGADATVTSDGRTAPLSDFLDANNTFRLTNDALTVKATPEAIAAGRSFTYEVTLSKDGAEIASDTGELKVKEPSYSSVSIDAKDNLNLKAGVLGEIEVEPTLVGIIQGAKATVVLKDQDGKTVDWETYFGADATVTSDDRTALLSDFLDVNNTFRLTNDELTVKATPEAIAAGRSFTYEVTLSKDGTEIASDTGELKVKEPSYSSVTLEAKNNLGLESGVLGLIEVEPTLVGIIQGAKATVVLKDQDGVVVNWETYFGTDATVTADGRTAPLSDFLDANSTFRLTNDELTVKATPEAIAAGRSFTYEVTLSKDEAEIASDTGNLKVADPPASSVTIDAKDNLNLKSGVLGEIKVEPELVGIIQGAKATVVLKDQDGKTVNWETYFGADATVTADNRTALLSDFLDVNSTFRLTNDDLTVKATPEAIAAGRSFTYEVTLSKDGVDIASDTANLTVADPPASSVAIDAKDNLNLKSGVLGEIKVEPTVVGIIQGAKAKVVLKDQDGVVVNWETYFGADATVTADGRTASLADFLGGTFRLTNDELTVNAIPEAIAAGRSFTYEVTLSKNDTEIASDTGNLTVADPSSSSVSLDAKDSLNLEIEKLGEIKVKPAIDGIIRDAKAEVVLKDQDGVVVNWETYFGADATVTAGGNTASLADFLAGTFRLTNDELTVKATPTAIAAGCTFTYEVTLRKNGNFIADDTGNLKVALYTKNLREEIIAATEDMENATTSIAAIRDVLNEAKAIVDPTEALSNAIKDLEEALEDVVTSRGALKDDRDYGFYKLIEVGVTQGAINNATTAIEDARAELADAIKALAEAKAALDNADISKGTPKVTPAAILIYKGDSLPIAPIGESNPDGTFTWGEFANHSPDAASTRPAIFTPNDRIAYYTVTFEVQVEVLITEELTDAVSGAKTLLDSVGVSIAAITDVINEAKAIKDPKPALTQAIVALENAVSTAVTSRAALEAAREDGIDTLGMSAPENTQDGINADVKAIKDASDALKIAFDIIADAKAVLDAADRSKATPKVTPDAISIYEGGSLPILPTGVSNPAGTFAWGALADHSPDETSTQPAIFTPNDKVTYETITFAVQVNVLLRGDLIEAVSDAKTLWDEAGTSITDIDKVISGAQAIEDPTQAVKDAIDELVKARDTAVTSRAALETARENGIDTLEKPASANTQDGIDADVKAIKDASDALQAALDKLVELEGILENADTSKADPVLISDGVEVRIYDDERVPLAASFTSDWVAEDEDGNPVEGTFDWADGANLNPDVSGNQPIQFTPDEKTKFNSNELDVYVNVLHKAELDSYIEAARVFLEWSDEKTGTDGGTVSQDAVARLETILASAEAVSARTASSNTQAAIDGALNALRDAFDALNINAPVIIPPVNVPGGNLPDTQQSGGNGTIVTVPNDTATTATTTTTTTTPAGGASLVKVTYNAKGGTMTIGGKKVKTTVIRFTPGSSIGKLPKPVRDNYKFVGWRYAAHKSTKSVAPGTKVTGNVTLLAEWQRIAYVKSKSKVVKLTLPKAKKVTTAKKGRKVYITGKSGKYYKIKIGSKQGYILKKNLTLQSTKYVKKTTYVTKKAKSKAKKLAKVKKGAKLTVIGVSGKYYKVKYKSKTKTVTGYILKKNTKKKK